MARSSELPSSRADSWTSFGSTTITGYGSPNSAFTCLSSRLVALSAGDRRSGLLPASGAVGLLFAVVLLSAVQPINGGEAGPAFLPETRHDFGIVRQAPRSCMDSCSKTGARHRSQSSGWSFLDRG